MIGVQHQRDVEGALHHFVGLLAGQRVQEIRREAQLRIARDHRACRCADGRNVVTMVAVCAISLTAFFSIRFGGHVA